MVSTSLNDITLSLSRDYGLVIIAAAAVGLECLVTGFIVMSRARNASFSKEFMKKNFEELHKKEIGGPIGDSGYPDMGCGRYAEKLSYKEWVQFNNATRAHYNFVEQIGIVVPAILISGLAYPCLSALCGLVYFVGRALYAFGYTTSKGAKGRMVGGIILDLGLLPLLVMPFITGYKIYTAVAKN